MLLNLHSYYSFRYGTLSLRQLIDGMSANGYDTAVLTDINNSTALLDFIRESRAAGLNGLAGMEFRNGDRLSYIGIAKNERGFKELNDFMTEANRRGKPLVSAAIHSAPRCIFFLSCYEGGIPDLFVFGQELAAEHLKAVLSMSCLSLQLRYTLRNIIENIPFATDHFGVPGHVFSFGSRRARLNTHGRVS